MTPAAPARGTRHRRAPAGGAVAAALVPVVDALAGAARTRADALAAAAERDAATEVGRARREAARIVGAARASGARAAEQRAALQRAAARRDARQAVLAARRASYETLRRRAVEALERQGATPAGRELGELLEAMARARVGPVSAVSRAGPGALGVEATSDHRRAAIGPAALVDWALQALADGVESLWS
ncbi:MAG TPA: hypothetical protein VLZ77_06600 [Acidimicrobiales bacterium]|nr:hypothetical protein [Acidimicrobiales bacterium]